MCLFVGDKTSPRQQCLCLCHQLPIKEEYLERIFVKTINKLISKREEILSAVKSSVKEAIVELDYKQDDDNLIKIDKEIELLQNEIYNLSVKTQDKGNRR